MPSLTLSPHRLQKARAFFNLFNALNTTAWTFLAGNIITLFAMRLEASSTLVGLLTAINYMALSCLFFGRFFARRFPIVKIFTVAWSLRSFAMIPLLFAPHFSVTGRNGTAITLMLIGVTLFHVTRGIGMVGNNPLLSFLAQGADRGSYMTLIQIINNGVGMIATFALALILGSNPPLFVYSIVMSAGIVIGLASAAAISHVPEPHSSEKEMGSNFGKAVKDSLSQGPLKLFILIMFISCMVSGIVRTFVLVYAREVYYQGDGMVTLYTVFGSLGSLVIGVLVKFLIDRVGAKPLYVLCTIFGVISVIPALLFPAANAESASIVPVTLILYLSALFFIVNFAFLGAEGVGQTYFLGLVPRVHMLDMSIVYYFVYALAGAGGTFAAGILLDSMEALGLSSFTAFRVLHTLMIAALVVVLVLQRRLQSLGAIPFTKAINLLFSPRDMKAIVLLDKLDKSRGAGEEEEVLEELSGTASGFAVKALIEKLKSPRFSVRIEALNALYAVDALDETATSILLEDLRRNTHTTAYLSARVLGKHKVSEAVNEIRSVLDSEDFMLSGEAMIALARLGDKESLPHFERIIVETYNPRLKIMGFEALAILRDTGAIPVLVQSLLEKETASHVKDEASLALASILEVGNFYYKLLVRYENDPASFAALAKDEAEASYEFYLSQRGSVRKKEEGAPQGLLAESIKDAVAALVEKQDGTRLSRWILSLPPNIASETECLILASAVMDETLRSIDSFCLLITLWASRKLRILARI